MVYRSICVFLYLTMTSAAPQGGNSDITYVKMRPSSDPYVEPTQPRNLAARESRIENVPLIIPGSVDDEQIRKVRSDGDADDKRQLGSEEVKERTSEIKDERTSENRSESTHEERSEENVDEPIRQARSQDEDATDIPYDDREEDDIDAEEEYISGAENVDPTEKPVYSKSYFQTGSNFIDLASNHVVDYKEKRKFKSKCRCERIWNCPKLQITVPRCPTDYFMCCF